MEYSNIIDKKNENNFKPINLKDDINIQNNTNWKIRKFIYDEKSWIEKEAEKIRKKEQKMKERKLAKEKEIQKNKYKNDKIDVAYFKKIKICFLIKFTW